MPRKKSKGDPTVVSRKRKSKNNLNSQKKKHTDVAAGSGVSLADSIFGSNSSGGSLTSSIFGSDVKKSTINNDLFGSAEKFQRATEKRVEQNTTSIATNDINKTCSEHQTSLTKAQILKARGDRIKSKEAIDLTASISIAVPDVADKESELGEEDKDEIVRGEIKLFTIQCDTLMRENGVIIINSNGRLLEHEHMRSLKTQAGKIEDQICTKLNQKGNIFHVSEKSSSANSCISEENRKMEQDHSFRYHEVASRCLGRLDVRYKMDEAPFNDPRLVSNSFLQPVVNSLLGKDAKLVYAGLILSFPLSADQPWHQDGTALFDDHEFPNDKSLPPYALNVFIPLEDVTEGLGPTEFCVGSHYRDKAIRAMKFIENRDEKNAKVIGPLLKTGDALIYDYRVCHRGTQNLADKTRPMLYLMYARPWFREHVNFSEEKLFD